MKEFNREPMNSTIDFSFTAEQLQADPKLHLKLKEINGDPGLANDMEPGDVFEFRYGFNIVGPAGGLVNRLRLVRSLDPKKFDMLAPEMLLRELQIMRDSINGFEKFMTDIVIGNEGEEEYGDQEEG